MLDFPDAPAIDDVFVAGSKSYKWDGIAWMLASSAPVTGIRPVITALAPRVAGAADADLTITITGTDFAATSKVFIDTTEAAATFVSATEMTIPFSPATMGTGAYLITVNNSGLSSPASRFDVIYPPIISGLNPPAGIAGGPQHTLFVSGGQLTSYVEFPTTITYDGVDQPTTVTGVTAANAPMTPPAAAGTVMVSVHNGPVAAITSLPFVVA